MYDCVIILGGGINNNLEPYTYVKYRLDESIKHNTKYYLLSSRCTYHKSPPLDSNNFPVDETTVYSKYLIERGIPKEKILLENWSFDTIGNAYACLMLHCIPNKLLNILVITSDFHMERSKSIFNKIYGLASSEYNLDFKLDFKEVISNIDENRIVKEKWGYNDWLTKSSNILTLKDLHNFVFFNHNAYSVRKTQWKKWDNKYLKSYIE